MAVESARGFSSVATMAPTLIQRRLAYVIVALLIIVFAVTIRFGRVQLARIDSFVPTVEGISSVTDLLTAILLFSQFPASRSHRLLVLASGYLFCSLVVAMHALSFPGAFAPAGAFGGGPQATPWLYTFWRVGFSVAVLGYAWMRDGKPAVGEEMGAAPVPAIGGSIAIVVALALAVAAAVTVGEAHLPSLIADPQHFSPLSPIVAGLTLTLTVTALVLLCLRLDSLLSLSLIIVTCAFVAELAVNTFVITSRFSFGFYVSRAFSLVTSVIVLALLVSEIARLYARLARANTLLERERENRLMNVEAATSSIVHEVRQPLAAVSLNAGAAEIYLGRKPPDHERALAAVRGVIAGTQRTAEMLDAIRALFGKGGERRGHIDVNSVALDALGSLQAELKDVGVEVLTELTANLPSIYGSRSQLREVILNLVHNAIEAMQATTGRRRLLRVSTQPHDRDAIAVTVADSGPGIDPDGLEKIFDAFVTTKTHGMGLGLAICRTIVDRHGGRLTASSDTNGALFRLILPTTRLDGAGAD